MKQHKDILVKNSLLKSAEALDDARYAFDDNRYSNAQNRIYYAIFYSVMALGYLTGFVTAKHGQLLGWFNKKFIYEEKIFDSEMYAIYKTAYEYRMKSDYEFTWKPTKEKVSKSLEDARKFTEILGKYIESNSK